MTRNWSYTYASCAGASHLKQGLGKDDVCRAFLANESKNIFCGIVCDGAGSAKFGGVGAWLTATIFSRNCKNFYKENVNLPSDEIVWHWIDEVRDTIDKLANDQLLELSDFATTLILTISDGEHTLIGHIGDGAVVAHRNNKWHCLSWPEHGEYASTTRFITQNTTPELRIFRTIEPIDAVLLFSDGLERLALDFTKKEPFNPFLDKMLQPLNDQKECGHLTDLSKALQTYLNSEKINSRTDDDKTLIIARCI
ncbi:MAG: protein phosphatase 2C domain-containing protein [Hyphomicrobiales bacterium]|nr:protein phosphatase 2C domain-containing protein [Hyphomicrobiales bacterium]